MKHSDEELVRRTLTGENRAFDQLVQKYQAAVYALTYKWTDNFSDAQDLTQECFTHAFEKLTRLRDPKRFAGWLRTTATNVCRMWHRNHRKALTLHDDIDQLGVLLNSSRQVLPDTEIEHRETRRTKDSVLQHRDDFKS
jgi:RNA polymerase sigma-70 factor (ECF subfamily)